MSYIPWDMIKSEQDLTELRDGSWIDPTTCPPGMAPPAPHQGVCVCVCGVCVCVCVYMCVHMCVRCVCVCLCVHVSMHSCL